MSIKKCLWIIFFLYWPSPPLYNHQCHPMKEKEITPIFTYHSSFMNAGVCGGKEHTGLTCEYSIPDIWSWKFTDVMSTGLWLVSCHYSKGACALMFSWNVFSEALWHEIEPWDWTAFLPCVPFEWSSFCCTNSIPELSQLPHGCWMGRRDCSKGVGDSTHTYVPWPGKDMVQVHEIVIVGQDRGREIGLFGLVVIIPTSTGFKRPTLVSKE